MKIPQPIELTSDKVRLVPLSSEHLAGFYQAGKDDALWRWAPPHQCRDLATAKVWLELALEKVAQRQQLAFVIIDIVSDQIVGSTRYCSIDLENNGIEIGFTFIAPQFQRSYVNSHAKFLLLEHAFEQLGAIRVQFRTHQYNQKSRNAIARLGATFEGIIRHQRILAGGEIRDTAQFSITDLDWPQIKPRLAENLVHRSVTKTQVSPLPASYQQLITAHPLAQLMIACDNNLSEQIVHLPLIYDCASGKLAGHISADNKLNWLLEHGPEIVIVFQGDDAYISPFIHPDIVVPTWNYQVLHLSAAFRFVADNQPELKRELLEQQIAQFEPSGWRLDSQSPELIEKMMAHIRCFELTITKASHCFKLSQNKSGEIVSAIARDLETQGKGQFADNHRNGG